MENIIAILKKLGIEVPEDKEKELDKEVLKNYKTISDYDKQTAARDSYKEQYDKVKVDLDKFDGVDVEALKKQITEAQAQAKKAEEDAAAKIAKRDYTDAVSKQVSTLTFSSESAKKAFTADLIAQDLKLKDGSLMGFTDFVETYKKTDPQAIVDKEAAEKKAKFTESTSGGGGEKKGTLKSALMDYYKKG